MQAIYLISPKPWLTHSLSGSAISDLIITPITQELALATAYCHTHHPRIASLLKGKIQTSNYSSQQVSIAFSSPWSSEDGVLGQREPG